MGFRAHYSNLQFQPFIQLIIPATQRDKNFVTLVQFLPIKTTTSYLSLKKLLELFGSC